MSEMISSRPLAEPGAGRRDARAELDRAAGAGRRELDYAERVAAADVGVEPPPEALVELLRAVDVGDGDDDDLELQVDLGATLAVPVASFARASFVLMAASLAVWDQPSRFD